jgi:histidyl-tRNA synthetase
MRLADKFAARYTLLIGKMEVLKKKLILRDMKAGKQKEIPMDGAIETVIKLIGKKNLDKYTLKDQIGDIDED